MNNTVTTQPRQGTQRAVTLHAIDVDEVVETVKEFGVASLELVAWEFSVSEDSVATAWNRAVRKQLIRPVGPCPETGEGLFAIAA
jgi:hypothetical protein